MSRKVSQVIKYLEIVSISASSCVSWLVNGSLSEKVIVMSTTKSFKTKQEPAPRLKLRINIQLRNMFMCT